MKSPLTANRIQGRAIGAIIFAGFGGLWLILALYVRESLHAGAAAGIGLITAGLVLMALHTMREARRFPRLPDDPRISRVFHTVNAVQWIAAFIVASVLRRLHLDPWTVPAIAAIVGLHLFPLARLFRHPLHYVTGSILVLWAAGASIFAPAEHLQSITALGTGITLWCSAAVGLLLTWRDASRSPERLQAIRPEAA
jgi:hypothetical protein